MKSRLSIPDQYRKQVQEQIKEEVKEYLDKKSIELAKRFCYGSVVALHDLYGNRFGKKPETQNYNYQRFADYMQHIVLDSIQESYEWADSKDPEAASKALKKELEDRNIHIDFE